MTFDIPSTKTSVELFTPPKYSGIKGKDKTNRLAGKASTTRGLFCLVRVEVCEKTLCTKTNNTKSETKSIASTGEKTIQNTQNFIFYFLKSFFDGAV